MLKQLDGSTFLSQDQSLVRGIPQGSILGPLLFVIYSSDVVHHIQHCHYHIYADDLQVYIKVPLTEVDARVVCLNEDLDRISRWADINCLVLNPTKSKFMVLGSKQQIDSLVLANPRVEILGKEIERVTEARNLGVLMDGELRFEQHIRAVAANCFYRLKMLYRIRSFVSAKLRLQLCETLVLSKLSYCANVYGPCLFKKTQKLVQRVQ